MFAWSIDQVLDINSSVTYDRLDIDPKVKSIRQRSKRMAQNRRSKFNESIDRLLSVGFIKPIEHPTWVSNIVAVPKKNR